MERGNKEKSKTYKAFICLYITPNKLKKEKNVFIHPHLKSGKLGYFAECDFAEKIQKLFDIKKFSIGNQFDQKGSEKFLAEKDECLKCMDLDYTILEKTKSKSNKRKRESKSKTEKRKMKINRKLKNAPQISIIKESDESFFSSETSKQIFKEFVK